MKTKAKNTKIEQGYYALDYSGYRTILIRNSFTLTWGFSFGGQSYDGFQRMVEAKQAAMKLMEEARARFYATLDKTPEFKPTPTRIEDISGAIVDAYIDLANFEFPDNNTPAKVRYREMIKPLQRKVNELIAKENYLFPEQVLSFLDEKFGSTY